MYVIAREGYTDPYLSENKMKKKCYDYLYYVKTYTKLSPDIVLDMVIETRACH